MRLAPLLLLTALLGAGLWFFLSAGGPTIEDEGPEEEPPVEAGHAADEMGAHHGKRLRLKTGTLAVIVRTTNGKAAHLAEVGYLKRDGKPRWFNAITGKRTITDAPLGDLTVVARAQGFVQASQPTRVIAGVPSEVVLLLRPEKKGTETGTED